MDGVWLEDGSFEINAKGSGTKAVKGKGKKGKKGKSKGKGEKKPEELTLEAARARASAPVADDEPAAKKPRLDEDEPEEESEEDWYEREWKDQQVCLINLKSAALNGVVGIVKQNMGIEEVIVDGKRKKIRRFTICLEGGKGDKSIKMENLFKVMTGSIVKLRGLDTVELNDSLAECGRLDAASMRYDVTLADSRHLKVKPSNIDFVAKYETAEAAGDSDQMEWIRSCSGLTDLLAAIEWFNYPVPQFVPSEALENYAKKFPKSIVIGQSKAANPKGIQVLGREVTSSLKLPPHSRLIFVSMPREKACVAPSLPEMRHDELLRLGKFAEWVAKRSAPRPVFFLLPGTVAKGPPSVLSSATCAWPLYMTICTDVIIMNSERWQKSPWARLDALTGALWARKPLYLLPEKYVPPIELAGVAAPVVGAGDGAGSAAKEEPLSFRQEEPLTVARPTDGLSSPPALLLALAARAEEAEVGAAKVQKLSLAVRSLG